MEKMKLEMNKKKNMKFYIIKKKKLMKTYVKCKVIQKKEIFKLKNQKNLIQIKLFLLVKIIML